MAEVQSGLWTPSRYQFTSAEIVQLMKELSSVFDAVRLVEPSTGRQWTLDEGNNLQECPHQCWAAWHRDSHCAHCISCRAMEQKNRATKFEFAGDDLHHVTAKYVEVDGSPRSMELVSHVSDEAMLEGYGRNEVVEVITRHNRRVYSDPLTGAYNRRYLEDTSQGLIAGRAVAMIDADDFKRVNDSYGHAAGDQVLKGIVEAIKACIRTADAVVRYGGDEFVVIFNGMSPEKLPEKLEQIRQHVRDLEFTDAPAHRQTVSIGAAHGDGTLMELIGRADKMLYRSKEAGKDRIDYERAHQAL